MAHKRTKRGDTRADLLDAAAELFAAHGYHQTTHAEICERAGANIAAINYHFGDKEHLYAEAWRHAFDQSVAAYPPDGGVPADAPAEERLRGRILSIVRRMSDPKSHQFDIVHKEMANPTGLLSDVMRVSIGPFSQELDQIVRELLGDDATDELVKLCGLSVKALCFGPLMHRRQFLGAPKGTWIPPGLTVNVDDDTLAEHITRFCLAGMRGVTGSTDG